MEATQCDGRADPAADSYARALLEGRYDRALAIVTQTLARGHRASGSRGSLEPWLRALDTELVRHEGGLAAHLEPELFAAALPVFCSMPAHPALPLWAARALGRLRAPGSPDVALAAGRFAFEFALRGGNFPLMREVVGLVRPLCAGATRARRIEWLEGEALALWLDAEHAAAFAAVDEACGLGGSYGVLEQGASAALSAGNLRRMESHLAAIDRNRGVGRRPRDAAHRAFLEAGLALARGEAERANLAMEACRRASSGGVPAYFACLWRLGRAHVALARGDARAAERALARSLSEAAGHYWRFLEFSARMARAWARIRDGRPEDACRDLDAALALACAYGYRNVDPWWTPAMARDLVEHAAPGVQDPETLLAWAARRRVER